MPSHAPRLVLVLGGGGARGLAHAGVLQELETLRIPVDAVVGTSMGAIVGGAYAAGYAPAEILAALRRIDWLDVFSERPHRDNWPYRRKQDDRADLLDFEAGLGADGLRLPRSLVAGQKLTFALDLSGLHVAGVDGFDALPLPFRAVATELRSGGPVALDRGSLVRALRASMSVPGVFPPVPWEGGGLLVDGGVARNVPVDVARQLGAGVVVAVDVGEGPQYDPQVPLDTALDVMLRVLDVALQPGVQTSLRQADVVVHPDLGDVRFIDFTELDAAVAAGRRAVRALADTLRPWVVSPAEFDAYVARQRRRRVFEAPIDTVMVSGDSRVDPRTVRAVLGVPQGARFDVRQVQRGIERLYGMGSFERVDFEVLRHGDAAALRVFADDKSWGPLLLRFGADGVSDLRGRSRIQTRARLTWIEIDGAGSELRTDAQLGTHSRLVAELYRPVEHRRRFFLAAHAGVGKRNEDVFDDTGRRLASWQRIEAVGGVDAGMAIGRIGEVRSGYLGRYRRVSLDGGTADPSEPLPGFEGAVAGWRTRVAFDVIDAPDFPSRGWEAWTTLFLSRRALGAERSYERFEARAAWFGSGAGLTGFAVVAGGGDLGSDLPADAWFRLGGFGDFAAHEADRLRGRTYGRLRLGLFAPFAGSADWLGAQAYGGAWVDVGDAWQRAGAARFDDLEVSTTLALGARTPLGPAWAAYAFGRGADRVLVVFGRQVGAGAPADVP